MKKKYFLDILAYIFLFLNHYFERYKYLKFKAVQYIFAEYPCFFTTQLEPKYLLNYWSNKENLNINIPKEK